MDTNQPQQSPARSNLTWLWVVLGILIIGGGAWYVIAQQNTSSSNSNATNQVTTNENTNIAGNINSVTNINSTSNANTSNVDWLTYIDQGSQVTVHYPPDWQTVTTSYATIGFRPKSSASTDPEWSAVYLTVRANPNSLSLENFYSAAEDFPNLFETSTSHETRTVGSYQATYFPNIPGAVANSAVAFRVGGYVIEVQMHRDQIGVIDNVENTFFSIAASVE